MNLRETEDKNVSWY